METKLVGVHSITTVNRKGVEVTHHYAWRGGPRIKAKEGTRAFIQEFAHLTRDRPTKAQGKTLGKLIEDFLESADYQKLKPITKRDYDRMIAVIRAKFGSFPIDALEAKGARKVFMA